MAPENPTPAPGPNPPSWQSTVIAIALMTLIGGIFIVVFLKSGTDAALKVWAVLGTLIGVLTGAIPTYFFQQGNVQAAQQNVAAAKGVADSAREEMHNAQAKAEQAEARYSALAGAASPEVVKQVQTDHKELF